MSESSPRTPDLDPAKLSEAGRSVYDRIMRGPRGEVVGPLRVWLLSPGLADRAQALGQYARYETPLPPELSELAILVTARIWSSGFEWSHHMPIAAEAGIAEETIRAIGAGRRPVLDDQDAEAVFDFAVALHRDRMVPDEIYERAEAALGTPALVDLVGICGYYGLISMTINAFQVPGGHDPALPEIDMPPEEMFRDP